MLEIALFFFEHKKNELSLFMRPLLKRNMLYLVRTWKIVSSKTDMFLI